MEIIKIHDICDPRVEVYNNLTDSVLRSCTLSRDGIFIAESPKVIEAALDAGYEPLSLLCEERHITGDASRIIQRMEDRITVYTGSRRILSSLTGYVLTRGVLCAMKRKKLLPVEDVVKDASRIAVIDDVCDSTNIGSIFRAAAALGIDGILLTPGSCDPLNRRSVRVSMGCVFRLPWTIMSENLSSLRNFGFKTVALALRPGSIPIDSPQLKNEPKLAMIFGSEGYGLRSEVIDRADYSVIIPMHNDVDSLNVASAASVTFWELRKKSLHNN